MEWAVSANLLVRKTGYSGHSTTKIVAVEDPVRQGNLPHPGAFERPDGQLGISMPGAIQ